MKTFGVILGGVIILTVLFTPLILYRYIWLNSCEVLTAQITSKENVVHGQTSKYLIFTQEEVFENEDAALIGKFNSSDFYNKLEPGTHKVRVCGWRVPFLSWYRNIIEIRD